MGLFIRIDEDRDDKEDENNNNDNDDRQKERYVKLRQRQGSLSPLLKTSFFREKKKINDQFVSKEFLTLLGRKKKKKKTLTQKIYAAMNKNHFKTF